MTDDLFGPELPQGNLEHVSERACVRLARFELQKALRSGEPQSQVHIKSALKYLDVVDV